MAWIKLNILQSSLALNASAVLRLVNNPNVKKRIEQNSLELDMTTVDDETIIEALAWPDSGAISANEFAIKINALLEKYL